MVTGKTLFRAWVLGANAQNNAVSWEDLPDSVRNGWLTAALVANNAETVGAEHIDLPDNEIEELSEPID